MAKSSNQSMYQFNMDNSRAATGYRKGGPLEKGRRERLVSNEDYGSRADRVLNDMGYLNADGTDRNGERINYAKEGRPDYASGFSPGYKSSYAPGHSPYEMHQRARTDPNTKLGRKRLRRQERKKQRMAGERMNEMKQQDNYQSQQKMKKDKGKRKDYRMS